MAGALNYMDPRDVSFKFIESSYPGLHGHDPDDVHHELATQPTPALKPPTAPPPRTLVHTTHPGPTKQAHSPHHHVHLVFPPFLAQAVIFAPFLLSPQNRAQ